MQVAYYNQFFKQAEPLTVSEFKLNNQLIANTDGHIQLNIVPNYYHWSPGLHINMLNLINDTSKVKYRLPLPKNSNLNFAGMLIGPKGQTLKDMEQ